jgi:hypothetical protein
MDPAAFATAHIGLEAIRRDAADLPNHARSDPSRRRQTNRTRIRNVIAAALRSAAAAIDTSPREQAPNA